MTTTVAGLAVPRPRRWALQLLAALAWPAAAASDHAARYPDIVSVQARAAGPDRFDFDVTVSSPYDTPQRYADGFRVATEAGAVLGERTLWHDHRHEQPFTRDLYGVVVPAGIRVVVVQGRDQLSGYGGRAVQVPLPGR